MTTMSLQSEGLGGEIEMGTTPSAASRQKSNDPARWVDEHGDVLYRYALARVRKPEVAQDLVQDTLLAAMRARDRFAGQSSVRSWLCGILKHKLCDYYRKLGRETSFTDLEFLEDECAEKFVPEGFWVHMTGPKEWRPAPDEVMHRDDFWQTMKDCLSKLPERVATVFMMREMDDVESKEICAILAISENNLWVMLHRARMGLRECLALNWFENPTVRR
jgi:RNA polymerase sigma-70 factor (TIGR02943 family)